jgi:uncharacterized RDD family membrane protein YckC
VSAGFGRRLAALIYDALLCAALLMVFTGTALLFTHGHAVIEENVGHWVYVYRCGLVAVVAGYFSATCVHTGHTLGMRAWRLSLRGRSKPRVGYPRALWRFALAIPAWGLCGLGTAWLLVDRDRLALQDRLSGTRVFVIPKASADPPASMAD